MFLPPAYKQYDGRLCFHRCLSVHREGGGTPRDVQVLSGVPLPRPEVPPGYMTVYSTTVSRGYLPPPSLMMNM